YHRLSVVPIHLPPLSEHTEDIPLLAQTFLESCSGGAKLLSPDALDLLCKLQWKGNVRELKNTVERIAIFVRTPTISAPQIQEIGIGSGIAVGSLLRTELSRLLDAGKGSTDVLQSLDRDLVQLALERAGGNVSQAARILGIDRHSLQRRIDRLDM
ncbi:MAG: sigma-54-dependent Fis family transcriptional regulator, partial [Bacteroidetes bacterium]|nr:sigma-54-dependent Fis family transcriptional regulator [Bacteroidota bacterium]